MTFAIEKRFVKQETWLVEIVMNAYFQSQTMVCDEVFKLGSFMDSLPWFGQEFAETRELIGDNYYFYGINVTRKILATLFRYSYQQSMYSRE